MRRAISRGEGAIVEDGPFVSFTDLFVGILFLFIILVAALMIMQRANVEIARKTNKDTATIIRLNAEAHNIRSALQDAYEKINDLNKGFDYLKSEYSKLQAAKKDADERIGVLTMSVNDKDREINDYKNQLQAHQAAPTTDLTAKSELDAIHARDAEHPPFRLSIVYNVYRSANARRFEPYAPIEFSQTIQVFSAQKNGHSLCIKNVRVDYGGSADWAKPRNYKPLTNENNDFRAVGECLLTASGENWETSNSKVSMKRVSNDLYEGFEALRMNDGETIYHRVQYQVLGVFDERLKW